MKMLLMLAGLASLSVAAATVDQAALYSHTLPVTFQGSGGLVQLRLPRDELAFFLEPHRQRRGAGTERVATASAARTTRSARQLRRFRAIHQAPARLPANRLDTASRCIASSASGTIFARHAPRRAGQAQQATHQPVKDAGQYTACAHSQPNRFRRRCSMTLTVKIPSMTTL